VSDPIADTAGAHTALLVDAAEDRGEGAFVPERLIVSPTTGTFFPLDPEIVTAEGEIVFPGTAMGIVQAGRDDIVVKSVFRGFLMGMLVHSGERVREGQAIAWIRTL